MRLFWTLYYKRWTQLKLIICMRRQIKERHLYKRWYYQCCDLLLFLIFLNRFLAITWLQKVITNQKTKLLQIKRRENTGNILRQKIAMPWGLWMKNQQLQNKKNWRTRRWVASSQHMRCWKSVFHVLKRLLAWKRVYGKKNVELWNSSLMKKEDLRNWVNYLIDSRLFEFDA